MTLGLSWALRGWTGWSVRMLAWFVALGVSVICQRRVGEVLKPEDPYPALRDSHPSITPLPAQAQPGASQLISAMRRF